MESILEKVQLTAIDKSSWQTYRFDQIAKSIGERVEPTETDLEIYVGLEHIDSDSVHIKRFGKREDVTGTKLRCYPGDVIFGRRRAYQRKAAIVEFDGFCSAHSLVLRANPAVIDPKLFPFFLHSDTFMHRAVDISVGSLSPTINWGSLKKEEFLLPPKAQQAQIAELLWAADEVVEREVKLIESINAFFEAQREALVMNSAVKWIKLGDVVRRKISYGIVQAGPHVDNGMPYIKSSNLTETGIVISDLQQTSLSIAEKYRRSEVNPGDIVFSLRGNLGQMNIVPDELEVANLTQGTARISVKIEYHNEYIKTAIEANGVQRRISVLSKGSTFKEISLEALRKLEIPLPHSIKEQKHISSRVAILNRLEILAGSKASNSEALKKSLINQIF